MNNLLHKMNLKLGGHNVYPSPDGLSLVQAAPTIVFGADVYHAPPGSLRPSFAALVSSIDRSLATYYTTVSAQPARLEIIRDLEDLVARHIRHFYESNHSCPPQRIIFYRDGVGMHQFGSVRQMELKAIRQACTRVGGAGYKPAIVFIIVQKRNHCRFFQPRTGAGHDNPHPGTVVDREVTTQSHFDFYMCSHYGLKGTSRPTHYHVLHDDLTLSADELQRFTFDLCHLYGRCTRLVSNPAPTYYAHLAADAAHFYMSDFADEAHHIESKEGAFATPVAPHLLNLIYYA